MTGEAGRPAPRWLEALSRFRAAGLPVSGILTLPLLLPLALGGCLENPFPGLQPEEASATPAEASAAAGELAPPAPDPAPAPEISMVPTQVLQPAPDVFTSEEWALWDGQRTLSGRWVALPDIVFSTRVRITDPETGASTDAALILRDPALAGPRLIVSSDAAQALGLRPGVAATVELVALQFGPVPEPAAAEGPADAMAASDGAAIAGGTPAAPPGPAPVARPARQTAAPVNHQGTAQGGDPAAAQEAPRAAAQAAATPTKPEPAPPVPASPGEPAGVPAISTAPAAPVPAAAQPAAAAPAQPAAQPAARSTTQPPALPLARPAVQPDPAPPAADTAAAIADGLPYIQAGIFADSANATGLITRLRDAGLTASAVLLQHRSRSLTRVLVGPFDSVEARDKALETVRRIGPDDATPVRG